jgi:hypothetical protein
MYVLRAAIVACFLLVAASLAYPCSCSNSTPIQRTSERYQDRAVFTAHVLGWLGSHKGNGQLWSDRVLAVVHERYWGMPWYWPRIVMLNGSGQCDIAMLIGEDYLVSGWRYHYAMIDVGVCSRTQPLKTAQLDLRTLDGSHCAGPGGTVLGHISNARDIKEILPIAKATVNLVDQTGNTYTSESDRDGIFELNHLPPGRYTVESLAAKDSYASAQGVNVVQGLCTDMPVLVRSYSLRGRVLPGLSAGVELLAFDGSSERVPSEFIEPDGRFYFRKVPDGEYILAVTTWQGATANELYYPGVSDRKKASRLRIKNGLLVGGHPLNFNPEKLPFVPIHAALDPPSESRRFSWRIHLVASNYLQTEKDWVPDAKFALLYGMRDAFYDIHLYGWSKRPAEYGDCRSEAILIMAKPGQAIIHLPVPTECR